MAVYVVGGRPNREIVLEAIRNLEKQKESCEAMITYIEHELRRYNIVLDSLAHEKRKQGEG